MLAMENRFSNISNFCLTCHSEVNINTQDSSCPRCNSTLTEYQNINNNTRTALPHDSSLVNNLKLDSMKNNKFIQNSSNIICESSVLVQAIQAPTSTDYEPLHRDATSAEIRDRICNWILHGSQYGSGSRCQNNFYSSVLDSPESPDVSMSSKGDNKNRNNRENDGSREGQQINGSISDGSDSSLGGEAATSFGYQNQSQIKMRSEVQVGNNTRSQVQNQTLNQIKGQSHFQVQNQFQHPIPTHNYNLHQMQNQTSIINNGHQHQHQYWDQNSRLQQSQEQFHTKVDSQNTFQTNGHSHIASYLGENNFNSKGQSQGPFQIHDQKSSNYLNWGHQHPHYLNGKQQSESIINGNNTNQHLKRWLENSMEYQNQPRMSSNGTEFSAYHGHISDPRQQTSFGVPVNDGHAEIPCYPPHQTQSTNISANYVGSKNISYSWGQNSQCNQSLLIRNTPIYSNTYDPESCQAYEKANNGQFNYNNSASIIPGLNKNVQKTGKSKSSSYSGTLDSMEDIENKDPANVNNYYYEVNQNQGHSQPLKLEIPASHQPISMYTPQKAFLIPTKTCTYSYGPLPQPLAQHHQTNDGGILNTSDLEKMRQGRSGNLIRHIPIDKGSADGKSPVAIRGRLGIFTECLGIMKGKPPVEDLIFQKLKEARDMGKVFPPARPSNFKWSQLDRREILPQYVKNNLKCQLCKELFKLSDKFLTRLHCEHVFHENCVIQWMRLSGSCPHCHSCMGLPGI